MSAIAAVQMCIVLRETILWIVSYDLHIQEGNVVLYRYDLYSVTLLDQDGQM